MPGNNGRIVFTSNRDDPPLDLRGNFEIYSMNPDGSGIARLTNAQGIDGTPVWSPDGKKIVFRTNRDHFDPDPTKTSYELYVMNANGSGQKRLTEGLSPAWSPDGKRIAFFTGRDGNQEIYVMNANGSGLTNLTKDPGSDNEPSWSADGKRIAFASNRGGAFRIWVMNPDGSGAKPLSAGPQDHHPAWSPSGQLVLFARSTASNIDLYTVRADGSGEKQLTNTPGIDFQGVWSPDGKKIVFSSDRDSSTRGLMHLYAMNANGTGAKRLLTGDAADLEGDWQSLPSPTQASAAARSYLAAHAKACKLVIGKLTAKSIAGGFRVTAGLKKAGKAATATFDVVAGAVTPVNATAKQIAKNCR